MHPTSEKNAATGVWRVRRWRDVDTCIDYRGIIRARSASAGGPLDRFWRHGCLCSGAFRSGRKDTGRLRSPFGWAQGTSWCALPPRCDSTV